MPKIIIQNLDNKEILTKIEDNSLLASIHNNDMDWMHACGAKGKCTTCKADVVEGMSNLSERTEIEEKFLAAGRLTENQRLTCQVKISGDVTIRVPKENQFDHMTYSE